MAAETLNVEPVQLHPARNLDELAAIVSALRSNANRLEAILRQIKPAVLMRQPPEN